MKTSFAHRSLSLEALEPRTLLAADVDIGAVNHAIVGTGGAYQVELSAENESHLVIVGTAQSNLTVDFTELPQYVTSLEISEFKSVTLFGQETLNSIIVKGVQTLNAPDTSLINGIWAENTGLITLRSAGHYVVLDGGKSVDLNVHDLSYTIIIVEGDIKRLGLASDSLPQTILTRNSNLVIEFFQPELITSVSGITAQSQLGRQGQFAVEDTSGIGDTAVVVITLPENEKLKIFLSRLRDLLQQSHSNSRADNQQLVFEFLSQEKLVLSPSAENSSQHLALEAGRLQSSSGEYRSWGNEDRPIVAGVNQRDHQLPTLGDIEFSRLRRESKQDMEEGASNFYSWASTDKDGESVQVESGVVSTEESTPHDLVSSLQQFGVVVVKLDEQRPTASDYIRQQISSEFLPGRRNAVLLVDPKPSRARSTANEDPLSSFS